MESSLIKKQELIISEFGGRKIRRNPDNWFNLGDLAQAGGKSRNFATKWLNTQEASEYIAVAESKMPNGILVDRQHGGSTDRGIWAHYKIARRFAQAVSAEVAWHVDEIVEGVVSSAPTAEQSEAKLCTVLDGFLKRLDSIPIIASDVREVKETLKQHGDELKQQGNEIQNIKAAISQQRRDFSKKAIDAALACVADHYTRHGKTTCPCCDQFTEKFEMHHWRGKGGSDPKILMPLSKDCHKTAEQSGGAAWHDDKEARFRIFQDRCERYFYNVGLMRSQKEWPVQLSLFGETT